MYPKINLTCTSYKRLELFKETFKSFFECCQDLDLINRFIICDDGSPLEDICEMRDLYPEFEIYPNPGKGQAASLNHLFNLVDTEYCFHCEDDWLFIKEGHFIRRLFDVMFDDPAIRNVSLRNWSGNEVQSINNPLLKYNLHRYRPGKEVFSEVLKTNSAWYGLTFNPSLHHLPTIKSLGPLDEGFNPNSRRWDRAQAKKYMDLGWKVANILEGPWIEHIGQDRSIYQQT